MNNNSFQKLPALIGNQNGGASPAMLAVIGTGVAAVLALGYWLGKAPTTAKVEDAPPAVLKKSPAVQKAAPQAAPSAQPVASEAALPKAEHEKVVSAELAKPGITAQAFLDSKPVQAWARQSPADLMEWLETAAVPKTAGGAPAGLKVAIFEWTKQDLNACAEWIKARPTSVNYDHSVRYLVEFMLPTDRAAAENWAATIRDPGLAQKAKALLMKR